MADELHIDDEHVIEDPETIKILGDPLRIQILGQIARLNDTGQLATAKILAKAIDVPQTKLYYHLNLLEKHDLLRVAETGLVSGIVEKRYQIRARRLRADVHIEPAQGEYTTEDLEAVLLPITSVLDNAVEKFKHAIQAQMAQPEGDDAPAWDQIHVQQTTLHLTEEEAKQFIQRLEEVIAEYKLSPEGKRYVYHLTSLFHPGQPSKSDSQES